MRAEQVTASPPVTQLLGLLVPSSNTSTEMDFREWLPADVSLHVARMFMADASVEACRALVRDYAPAAARDIGTTEPDVVVFSCTGAGAFLGERGEAELVARLSGISGAPVVSTNEAVTSLIEAHRPSAVAVITPYVEEITRGIVEARERAGHRVVRAAGMGITVNRDIARVEPPQLLEFAERQLAGADFDLLFVSCTNLRTAPVLAPLARRFGVPVVTSNRASFEAALAVLRDREAAAAVPASGRA